MRVWNRYQLMVLTRAAAAAITLTRCGTTEQAMSTTPDSIDRTVLPISEPKHEPITDVDARKPKTPRRFYVTAPEGAPNVATVLLDAIGFRQSSAFGGPVEM